MKITICGSMYHITAMKQAAATLESFGYEVVLPNPREGEIDYNLLSDDERATLKETLIQDHLDEINESDAIFVFNEDKKGVAGYIGGNTLMEMAFAYAQKIEIFLLKPSLDMSYTDEILGMKPIVVNGNLEAIDAYFKQLPTVFLSSKSPIKLSAVSRGMRRAGLYVQVLARPANSNVNEQPYSIDETYTGALNRHEALINDTETNQPAYYATIESGLCNLHESHNVFDCQVVIVETNKGERKVGISTGIEFPKEMTDKIPSQYPDFGVLVQKEYGSKLKDPHPYLTNHKLTRQKLLEEAVFNVTIQLSKS